MLPSAFFFSASRVYNPLLWKKKIGPVAYKRCAINRFIAGDLMGVNVLPYIINVFFPLPIRLPEIFPWHYWVSIGIAVDISIPNGYLMLRGIRDAGEETMIPKKEHTLYEGIYKKIRHPQAVGEMPFFWVIAFLCHSPFLLVYSIIWIPVFYWMCVAEERDPVLRYGKPYIEYQRRTGMLLPKRGCDGEK